MKPFKETKVGAWISENYPTVLHAIVGVAGTVYPPASGITMMLDKLIPDAPKEKRDELLSLLTEYENVDFKEYLLDVQSARAREVAINQSANSSWLSKNMLPMVALLTVAFAIAIFTLVLTKQLPSTDNLTFLVVGYVSGLATTVYNYLFGSTKSSVSKDETIKSLVK